jgi:hypothetical protein
MGGEVTINGRVWKRRNLRVTEYKDGTPIQRASTVQEFTDMSNRKEPAYFIDEKSGSMYYNRHVDVSESGVSPAGWGLPTAADVEELWEHYWGRYYEDEGHYGWYGPDAAAALTDPKGDFKYKEKGP